MFAYQQIKKKRKKALVITCILSGLALIAILITPLMQGEIIQPNIVYSEQQSPISRRYRLDVEEGKQYELVIWLTKSGQHNSVIRLYSNAFKLVGIRKYDSEYTSWTEESLIFTAEHDGFYYMTLNLFTRYIYSIVLYEGYYSHDSVTRSHTNFFKLGLIILPIFLVGMIAAIVFYKNIKYRGLQKSLDNINDKKSQARKFACPNCGVLLQKNAEYCKICGRTFKVPDHQLV